MSYAYMRTIMPLPRLLALAHLLEEVPYKWLGGRVEVIVEMEIGMQLLRIRHLENEVDISPRLFSGRFDVGCRANGLHAFTSHSLPQQIVVLPWVFIGLMVEERVLRKYSRAESMSYLSTPKKEQATADLHITDGPEFVLELQTGVQAAGVDRLVYFYVCTHGRDPALNALDDESLSPVVEVSQPRWESSLRFCSDSESLGKVSVQLISVSTTPRKPGR